MLLKPASYSLRMSVYNINNDASQQPTHVQLDWASVLVSFREALPSSSPKGPAPEGALHIRDLPAAALADLKAVIKAALPVPKAPSHAEINAMLPEHLLVGQPPNPARSS